MKKRRGWKMKRKKKNNKMGGVGRKGESTCRRGMRRSGLRIKKWKTVNITLGIKLANTHFFFIWQTAC
ncbi:hypothetical protein, partial [Escherichia coli]|uniref:hypothetical protein n=1 Tax=Escherichia coli TaxID=562 RepID=UPI001130A14A